MVYTLTNTEECNVCIMHDVCHVRHCVPEEAYEFQEEVFGDI